MVAQVESGEDMSKTVKCPRCQAGIAYRDGLTLKGKQRFRCRICGKSYIAVRDGVKPLVAELATKMLIEGIQVPVIAKVMRKHCSRRWLYSLKSSLVSNASR